MAAVYKIVFAGPSGAGKTEAIHTLSDDEVLSKEAAVYAPGQAGPASTVALDRGFVTLDNGDQLHLHGTSGHTGVDAMCGIVTTGSMGLVLLMDGRAADPLGDLCTSLDAFRHVIEQTRVVVGISRTRPSDRIIRPALADEMVARGLPPVVMSVDTRKKQDLIILLKTLIFSLPSPPRSTEASD